MVKIKFLLFVLVFVLPLQLGGEGQTDKKPGPVLTLSSTLVFAEALEKEGDYYRAITEYKRVIFSTEDKSLKLRAQKGIARCYRSGSKWKALEAQCRKVLEDTPQLKGAELNEWLLALSLSRWNLEDPYEANRLLDRLDITTLTKEDKKLMAWIRLAAGDSASASNQFKQVGLASYAEHLENWKVREKSPFLAGSLSALVPGSGQLYAGKPKAALGAFLFNGFLIGSTIEAFDQDHDVLGAGLGILGLGFYVSNIVSASRFAKDHNRQNFIKRDEYLARQLGLNREFRSKIGWNFTIPY